MTTPARASSSATSSPAGPPGRRPGRAARVFDAAVDAGGALAGVLLVALMTLVVVKVVFRYVLGLGLVGVDQVSGTMLLYATFLGAAWVLRRDGHVTIDLATARLGSAARRRLRAVTSMVGALVCLALTAYGMLEVVHSWRTGITIPAEIEIPRVVNLAVIPLGGALLAVQFVRRARER